MPVDRLKYLDFVQAAVTRMAANAFLLKGWTVTLATPVWDIAAFAKALLGA